MKEEKIIEELKSGNKEHFSYLYQKYEKTVYAIILNIVHNRDAAEELVQISFVKLYKNIKLYKEEVGTFYNFVRAIAKYTAFDYLRKKNNMEKVIDTNVIYDDSLVNFVNVDKSALDTVEKNEFMNLLKKLVNELCDTQRIAIVLICERGFSYKYAAKVMGVSESAFKSILYRARQTLKDKICDKYPEFKEEISSRKYVMKVILMAFIGITAISGLAYATYMICNEIWWNKSFTLSELRTEVSSDEAIVSRDEALEKLNYYLDVLGEEKATDEEVKLIKDYQMYKICWMVDREDMLLKIDSSNGELVRYINYSSDGVAFDNVKHELNEVLGLSNEYELKPNDDGQDLMTISYAKKYGEIYNTYDSVTFIVDNNELKMISVVKYPYEDSEIIISKERALEIAKENGIVADEIELVIEKIATVPNDDKMKLVEIVDTYNREEYELLTNSIKIKKLWKVESNSLIVYIDIETGELMYKIR